MSILKPGQKMQMKSSTTKVVSVENLSISCRDSIVLLVVIRKVHLLVEVRSNIEIFLGNMKVTSRHSIELENQNFYTGEIVNFLRVAYGEI